MRVLNPRAHKILFNGRCLQEYRDLFYDKMGSKRVYGKIMRLSNKNFRYYADYTLLLLYSHCKDVAKRVTINGPALKLCKWNLELRQLLYHA